MRRAYKFLLRPTARQAAALEACLEDTRQIYNAALEERREAWKKQQRAGLARQAQPAKPNTAESPRNPNPFIVNFYSQQAQLKDIRKADPDGLGRWSFGCERAAVRRLDRAFQSFFRRVKAGEKPGYPRFRGRGWWSSVEWPEHGNGCKWDSVPHPTVTRVYLLGIGNVRVHQHRAVRGRVKTVTVKREGNRWYVILSCDNVPASPLPDTGMAIGVDLGIMSFLTTSDGEHIPNPRPLAASAGRLISAQQSLARKKSGSNRRRKAKGRVAVLHAKVRRIRLDHAHKAALALVRDHDLIVHEALQVTSMTRRPKPCPAGDGTYDPNGAAAKAGLNKSILDAGWGVFLRVLAAKAESAGRTIIAVDARHTSQRCARCGHVAAGNRVTQAAFRCLACGHAAHADINAAINILRAGLALQATFNGPEKPLSAESLITGEEADDG